MTKQKAKKFMCNDCENYTGRNNPQKCEVMIILEQYAWNLQKPVSPRKAMEDALEGRSSIA